MPFSKGMRKTNIGFILAALLVTGVSAISYTSTQSLINDSQWVSHTHEVQTGLAELSTDLLLAQSWLEDYTDNHSSATFAQYSSESSLIMPQLKHLEELTSDNIVQQERIAELRLLAREKLDQWNRVANRHHSQAHAPLRVLASQEKPEEVGDRILKILSLMNDFEAKLLKQRTEQSSFAAKVALNVITVGGFLAILLLGFAVWRVNRDMKLREKAQEASRINAERAEQASRVQAQFLANMSHEIRTPLNGILGMADLILQSDLSPVQRKYGEMIHTSGTGLLHIINDILDFSKMDAGKLELESIVFSLRQLVDTQTEILSKSAREKKLQLSVSIDPSVPDSFRGDPSRIAQILMNLVGNAIKFTSVGTVVLSVACEKEFQDGTMLRFSITDTGIGIPADIQRKLFRPFTQADGSMARKYGGTGLGLSICKQLAELMSGSIGVESYDGVGSTFWFTCMVKAQAQKTLPTQATSRIGANQVSDICAKSSAAILVVEDNPVNQALVLAQLKKLGYTTYAVGNGKEALEAFSRGSFDLILMDCQMPEMDGFEATLRIRDLEVKRGTRTPILALTANAMREDEARCLAAGMDEFLTKPIKLDELAKALSRWSMAA